jgi:hypothetical protein
VTLVGLKRRLPLFSDETLICEDTAGEFLDSSKNEDRLTERMRKRLRGDSQEPQAEPRQSAPNVIDLTEASEKVAPEDYPVLVFLRDQLVQAREESDRLKQELEELQQHSQVVETGRYEAALSQLREHYEKLLDEEQSRRAELQSSVDSERFLRMDAETKIEAAREDVKRVRVELKTALKGERARAVEAREELERAQDEIVRLKTGISSIGDKLESSISATEVEGPRQSPETTGTPQKRRQPRNKRSGSSSASSAST